MTGFTEETIKKDGGHLISETPAAGGTHLQILHRYLDEMRVPLRLAYYARIVIDDNDVGAVRSNLPVPLESLLYYFEITVEKRGRGGRTSIGFTGESIRLRRHPGWEPETLWG